MILNHLMMSENGQTAQVRRLPISFDGDYFFTSSKSASTTSSSVFPPRAAPPPAAESSLPKYLQAPGKLKDEYLNPDGTFRERSQAELAKMTKAQKQEYDKAKKWWEREGKVLASQPPAEAEPKPAEAPAPTWLKREFDSFDKLCEIAESLAKEGGAG